MVTLLLEERLLEPKYQNHKLSGEFGDCRECHLQPDWLLIYREDLVNAAKMLDKENVSTGAI